MLLFVAKLATPQPLRLLKTEWCSVEIVAGHSHDFTLSSSGMSRCPLYCFHTMLHWYGSDGTHAKLDIRKIIRKCVKEVRTQICKPHTVLHIWKFSYHEIKLWC